MSNSKKLFVFEGPDGVGKTTLSRWFAGTLRNRGVPSVMWSSFPGCEKGSLGELVYKLHHHPSDFGIKRVHPLSLQLLHIAAHIDAIESQFAGWLDDGATIVLDRFWWSTWVYGRLAGADPTTLETLIEVEKRVWRNIKPAEIFLLSRRTSDDSKTHRRLEKLYGQLATKEAQFAPIKRIRNNGNLSKAESQILSFL